MKNKTFMIIKSGWKFNVCLTIFLIIMFLISYYIELKIQL